MLCTLVDAVGLVESEAQLMDSGFGVARRQLGLFDNNRTNGVRSSNGSPPRDVE